MDTNRDNEFLTFKEALQYTGTTRHVLSCLIKAGVLKSMKKAGRKYVYRQSADEFLRLGGASAQWVSQLVRATKPPKIRREWKEYMRARLQHLREYGPAVACPMELILLRKVRK